MAPPVNYDYDAIGRLAKLTDQAGAPTSFLYDKRSLLLSRTDPLLKTASLTYYDDGKVRTSKDRNNKTTTYTPSGKPATVSYQDGATVSFSYDQHDNLIGMQDALGAATYAYDPVMRLTSATDANGFTVSYEYDEAGNVTRLIYPGGRGVSYTYDELNRLKSVTIDWLKQTAVYSYDVAGRLTGLSQFNGAAVQFGYDDANRLTALDNRSSQASNVIAAYHFTLDANGNRIHVEHQAPLGLAVNAMSTDFSYNSKRNRLLAAGTTDFAYDDEGQLATKAQATYAFDSAHRLMSITGTGDDQFSYDGAGRRLSARRSGTVTRYIHDAAGNLLAEADGSGAITRYYIHGAGLLAMVTPAGALYCYHFDATGYTVALTDSTRTVVNKYAYSPFGAFTNQVEAIAQPFKFVGQFGVITEPNGLIYMRARYYDPQVGRFISEDPIGFDGGDVNLYAYVQNDPVNWVDPLGLFAFWGGTSVTGAGGVGGTVGGGVAYDSVAGGGFYNSVGPAYGFAGSAGLEAGFYTGSFLDAQDFYTVGIGPWSVGLVLGEDGWGLVGGVSLSFPIEGTHSQQRSRFYPDASLPLPGPVDSVCP